jgi:cobalt-zinc-cadmium efflux system outer membrane protein
MIAILIAAVVALCVTAGPASAQPPAPRGELRLGEALALVIEHHPELAGRSLGVRAREAASAQAGAWTNPELSLEVENIAGSGPFSGVDGAEATLALSQLIELGGKRGHRNAVAAFERDAAARGYEARRLDVVLETARAFIAVLAAQERLALAEQLLGVAETTRGAVAEQVQAGAALRVEASRAQVALETHRIDVDLARSELQRARRALASLWGAGEATFERAAGDLEAVRPQLPALDGLLAASGDNPDVTRWDVESQRLRSLASLERAARVPDLEFGAGFKYFNDIDESALVVGVTAPLPLFDRRADGARAFELEVGQAGQYRSAALQRIARDVSDAFEQLAGAHAEATGLRDTVLPVAQEAADGSSAAYRAGRLPLTAVLDAQRTLFELRSRYIDALERYHAAVAQLERLTGQAIAAEEDDR